MFKFKHGVCVAFMAALVAACGSGTQTSTVATSTARGTLDVNPPLRIGSVSAAAFTASFGASATGAALLPLLGTPVCGVDFYYLKFWTVGGAGETTLSSGALMVPTGPAPTCSGPRPIVLYAHGTSTDKTFNIADLTNTNNTEGQLIAAAFVAQGFIVVAPNYAGYDISTLGYHPYLNAVQNSNEMTDILAAARTALPNTLSSATSDSGQLLITGYSEGGYVAMATQRALEAAGVKITAAAPMSGPYATEAFADTIFFGGVDLGSTVFAPLTTTSYQQAYGNIYSATTDIYAPAYASGIATLLPSATPIDTIFSEGLLPELTLFDSTTPVIPGSPALTAALAVPVPSAQDPLAPLFDQGFGSTYLVINSFRESYAINAGTFVDGAGPLAPAGSVPNPATIPATLPTTLPAAEQAALQPAYNFRLAVNTNDLRYPASGPSAGTASPAWVPTAPTFLCGGNSDPTVFFSVNTGTMEKYWSALPAGALTVLDVNATPSGPFAALQTAFQAHQAALLAYYLSPAGGSLPLAEAEGEVAAATHQAESPFCAVAARSFFNQVLGG